ncbi:hypothetical protein [Microbacterium sp.]|uniref:hypothetical protein n=1 Tax=Microbacterium sp. TaxID=51671 RepID=UPI00262E5A90|nr:hypothetical protein [Microbacterium sp.]
MSDDINITHGGAIEVDPEALRAVANGIRRLAPKYADAVTAIRSAYWVIINEPGFSSRVDTVALSAGGDRVQALHDECVETAENTLLMADVYELVERKVELAGLAVQGQAAPDSLLDRITELEESDPRVTVMEQLLIAHWKQGEAHQLLPDEFPYMGSLWGAVLLGLTTLVGKTRLGVLPPGTKLSGSGGPVSVTPGRVAAPAGPPNGLAEALRRFPDGDGAQLKVEKYTMADGSKKFVVYSKGTQLTLDRDEPFDPVRSNGDLYLERTESASYAAMEEALKAAGAEPGDEVHIYAHSQAAMNAGYFATQSEFDVPVVVTAGSPTTFAVGDDQLLIQLLHDDDFVTRLAGGGLPSGTGAPESVIISRDADPLDWPGGEHQMENYVETAEIADESGDVRLEAWHDKTGKLSEAVSVESTEYVARRE